MDFVQDGVDLAVRMGDLKDAGLVARKLGEFTLGVFGSKAFLAAHGAPKTLDAMEAARCIGFVLPRTGRVLPWLMASPNAEFAPASKLRCAEDPRAGIVLAKAGLGLFQTYHFMVKDELASGALVEVLKSRAGRTRRFSLVYLKDALASRATRAVAELLADSVARPTLPRALKAR